jgi:hypothetical protein
LPEGPAVAFSCCPDDDRVASWPPCFLPLWVIAAPATPSGGPEDEVRKGLTGCELPGGGAGRIGGRWARAEETD